MNWVTLGVDGMLNQSAAQITDPLACLGFGLILDQGTPLRHFFKMLDNYPLLVRLNAFLPDLSAQYQKSPASACRCDDFDYLEFSKTVEMVGFPGDPRLEIYTSIQGKKNHHQISIRNYPLALLLDMELRLGKLRHVVFGDKVNTFQFDTVITLFEFIDGIVWELSFQTLPKECQLRK